ncbi:MAG: HD domain-containing phosphohydrolase [Pseudomonadota bacterium]
MTIDKNYSKNPRINVIIEKILDELCPFLEEQAREISDLTAIGKALGTGKDISTLLDMILSIARRFTQADGGTLYLCDHENQSLVFHVIHNTSLNIKESGSTINLPKVRLYKDDGTSNLSNVSSYVFHTGEIVNIEDVYTTPKFQFDGTKQFDSALNYRSQSMVVIPMKNHEDEIIGILQLINAIDPLSKQTIPFSKNAQEKAAALANLTSVILTQQMLIVEMKELFEAFINAIAVSIDEKSKHTGGHIQRVTELSMMIAQKINLDQNKFKDTLLSTDQLDELRISALMHDTGKITTPDHIINKSSRLETICDRFDLIKTRWDLFKTNQKLMAAQAKLALFDQNTKTSEIELIDNDCKNKIQILDQEFKVLSDINICKSSLNPLDVEKLVAIHEKSETIFGQKMHYLTDDEFENLNIIKGTLTYKERRIINSHADITQRILSKLPWPKKLAKIPSIASAHHEKLNGSGYPLQLTQDHLNIQARILAIADIFEALSARDRPYKNPMLLSQSKKILEQMGKNNLLDDDIISLFFLTDTHMEYAKKHLPLSQIDI